jgi:hypothetical protein
MVMEFDVLDVARKLVKYVVYSISFLFFYLKKEEEIFS